MYMLFLLVKQILFSIRQDFRSNPTLKHATLTAMLVRADDKRNVGPDDASSVIVLLATPRTKLCSSN